QAAEPGRQPAQRHDEPKLRSTQLDDETELHTPRESHAVLTFALRFRERIPASQEVRDQLNPAVGREGQVAHAIRRIERAPDQLAPRAHMLRPWHDGAADVHVGSRLVAREPALLDQVVAQLRETETVLVVVEPRAGEHPQPHVAEARSVAVAMLQAET